MQEVFATMFVHTFVASCKHKSFYAAKKFKCKTIKVAIKTFIAKC